MSTSTVQTSGIIGTNLLTMINTTTIGTGSWTTAVVVIAILLTLETTKAGNIRLNLNVDVTSSDFSGQGRSVKGGNERVGGEIFAIFLELNLLGCNGSVWRQTFNQCQILWHWPPHDQCPWMNQEKLTGLSFWECFYKHGAIWQLGAKFAKAAVLPVLLLKISKVQYIVIL